MTSFEDAAFKRIIKSFIHVYLTCYSSFERSIKRGVLKSVSRFSVIDGIKFLKKN